MTTREIMLAAYLLCSALAYVFIRNASILSHREDEDLDQ
jgi:hypothetical protein